MPIPVSDWPTSLATLDEVYDRLNITEPDASDADELALFLNSAARVLQDLYGDVVPTSYTERLRPYGDGTRLLTGRSPLRSVDSVTVTWPYQGAPSYVLGTAVYTANLATGEVTLFAMSPAFSWQYAARDWSTAWFTVTYTAGRATVADNVKDAVLELLRVNWRPQQAGNWPGNDDGAGTTYLGFYVPNSVTERLQAGIRPRQIA